MTRRSVRVRPVPRTNIDVPRLSRALLALARELEAQVSEDAAQAREQQVTVSPSTEEAA